MDLLRGEFALGGREKSDCNPLSPFISTHPAHFPEKKGLRFFDSPGEERRIER
jgi:hypothetical protein